MAAKKAPTKEPRPPVTTTVKLSIRSELPIDGDRAISGAATTPDRPASAVPNATTPILRRSVSTPCMAVVRESTLDARTYRSARLKCNQALKPSATATATEITARKSEEPRVGNE